MLPRVPTMLAHYRLLECIDSGGMGVVYRGHNTHLDCDVAIKILPSHVLDDSESRRKLRHEAHLLSKLHNPHVAVVHDYDRQDDVDFIVLEYVPGTTLAERIAAGPLHESAALDLGIQLADGLAAVHAAGLVHCDVTPRNIRITPDGGLKLLDFGLARHLRNLPDGTTSSGSLGGAFGTPPYMAPEMLQEGRFDARVDIYATGTVLYEMATGRRPFDADVPGRLVQAILHEAPLPPRSVNSRLSAGFEAVILKALDKDPKRRYQSAREVGVDLDRIRNAGIPTSPSMRVPPARRRRLWVAAGVALVVAALAVGRALRSDRAPLRATDLVQVVAWPGEKFNSRLSPDAQWVSFVARHGGRYGLWLWQHSMSEPRLVQESAATIASHMWSPDGQHIVLLLDEPEGTYLRCMPSQGGPTVWSLQLQPVFGAASLLRWIGSKIYFEVRGDGLWTLDTATSATQRLLEARTVGGSRIDFDVSPRTQRVLFTRVEGVQSSLWTCRDDGTDARPVRDGLHDESRGRWLDASGQRLVFSAAQPGPLDLWSIELGGHDPTRLTFGSSAERVEDVALDGSALTFIETRETSALWLLPSAPGARPRRLTAENTVDLWPTTSERGDVVVFQRSDPATPDSIRHGARLLRLRLASPDAVATPLAARGGQALASPDGRFVAYVRRDRPSPAGQLWMADERTEHAWRVASDVALPSLHWFPIEMRERMMVWRRTGPTLYWVARQGDRRSVYRWRAGSAAGGEPVFADSTAALILDLHVSPDDRWLAYVRSTRGTPARYEVRFYDLDANDGQIHSVASASDPDRLSIAGWIDGRTLLLGRTTTNPARTRSIQFCRLSLDGTETPLGVVDHGFVGAARLDRSRRTLLMSRAADEGVQNIYAVDLGTFHLKRLTDNKQEGIGFSGITPLPDGSTLFVQHEKNESIWLVRIEGSATTERSGSWLRRIKFPIS